MAFHSVDDRLVHMIHYIVSNTEPSQLGATKLNKVMWKADVEFYRRYGKTISGQMSYIRMPQGPVPNDVNYAIENLKKDEKIAERRVATQVGVRREFVWIERASIGSLAAEEVEELHNAIKLVCPLSARQASDATHGPLWEEIEDGEQMPIRAASMVPDELTLEDIEWARAESGA